MDYPCQILLLWLLSAVYVSLCATHHLLLVILNDPNPLFFRFTLLFNRFGGLAGLACTGPHVASPAGLLISLQDESFLLTCCRNNNYKHNCSLLACRHGVLEASGRFDLSSSWHVSVIECSSAVYFIT